MKITVYHGAKPYFPLLACCQHLGYLRDSDPVVMTGSDWNWHNNPLCILGPDKNGAVVCCMVHGRYGGLYRRSIEGAAAIFGLTVNCIDVDDLLFRQVQSNVSALAGYMLVKYLPGVFGQRFRKTLNELIEPHLLQ